jgi:hypothetical protein
MGKGQRNEQIYVDHPLRSSEYRPPRRPAEQPGLFALGRQSGLLEARGRLAIDFVHIVADQLGESAANSFRT